MNEALNPQEQKRFVSPFFGCCSYRDPKSKSCKWCPYFIPMSVCSTCCVLGRIVTKYEKEDAVCLEMGPKGGICCCASNVIAGPLGWALCGFLMRQEIVKKYNVIDDEVACPVKFCCFPMSYFQMLMSLNEWQSSDPATTATTGTTSGKV